MTSPGVPRIVFLHPHPASAPHAALVRIRALSEALASLGAQPELWSGTDLSLDSLDDVTGETGPVVLVARGAEGARLLAGFGRRPGVRVLFELHRPPATEAPWRPWPRLRLHRTVRRALARADGLLFVSDAVAEDLGSEIRRAGADDTPTLVLPSGAPEPVATPPPDSTRDLDVVYAGKLQRRKGVDDLLAAWRRLPDHRLTLAGGTSKDMERARAQARRLGVAERVDFLGHLEPDRVPALLARAKVAVSPLPADDPVAARYTSPLKVLEALAAGTPLVATAVAPVEALVTDGETALLAPPGDPAGLAAALARLLRDRPLALSLAARGLDTAGCYTWERRAAALLDFLKFF